MGNSLFVSDLPELATIHTVGAVPGGAVSVDAVPKDSVRAEQGRFESRFADFLYFCIELFAIEKRDAVVRLQKFSNYNNRKGLTRPYLRAFFFLTR